MENTNNIINNKPVILFDGECILCNGFVQFVIHHDVKKYFLFAPLQSEAGEYLLNHHHLTSNKLSTIRLFANGKVYDRSKAVLKILQRLKPPVSWLYAFVIIPSFIRNPLYNWIAKNRYKWFGKKEQCMVPTADIANRFLTL